METTDHGFTPGRPAKGTGEVVIIRTESPTADVWAASWTDGENHHVGGPADASLDECWAWAWSKDIKPSEIRIITSNPAGDGPSLILTQTAEYDSRVGLDDAVLGPDGQPAQQGAPREATQSDR